MLDIDTDGDLGIVDRRKGDEGGVILSRVLDGTRLTADGVTGLDAGGGAVFDGEAHTFDDGGIGLGGNLRLTLREITLVLRVLMDMGHEVPATVGDGDGEVAELQGRAGDITLSHTCPPDRLSIPPFLIATVQVVGSCQESALFAWDIDVHGSAQAHRLHIGAPDGDGLIARGIHEVVVDHRGEGHEEPRVARLCEGFFECEGRTVLMTAHLDIAVGDAIVALDGGGGGDDALREQGECLCRLEGGARGIGFADGLTHIAALRRVSGQTENLTIGGVDGDDAARLVLKEAFSELLERRTQGEWSVGR